jgi:hypothetical protein
MYSISVNYERMYGYIPERLTCWKKFQKVTDTRNIACIFVVRKLLSLGMFLTQLVFYAIYMNTVNGLKNNNENDTYNFEPLCNCTSNITINGTNDSMVNSSTYNITIGYTIIIVFLIINWYGNMD